MVELVATEVVVHNASSRGRKRGSCTVAGTHESLALEKARNVLQRFGPVCDSDYSSESAGDQLRSW